MCLLTKERIKRIDVVILINEYILKKKFFTDHVTKKLVCLFHLLFNCKYYLILFVDLSISFVNHSHFLHWF